MEKIKPKPTFDVKVFLAKAKGGRTRAEFQKNGVVYSQGETADSIFYIHKGKVKLIVISKQGKEAVIGILGPGDFFGEGCLAGQPLRMSPAVSMSSSSI